MVPTLQVYNIGSRIFEHIILIPSQPIFALSLYFCVLSGEATNINCIVLGLTREHANHYATDAVILIDVTT
jgi:hypothetical protein